ncbi:MAG: PTS sugar transporter subunit IIA [Planctomycetota bacterium]|jgi:mannitol/fructose-specific phosphotransferase system IIA component (Ntr-type)
MKILDILDPRAIKVPLVSTEKREAIRELVDLLAESGQISAAEDVDRVVWEREQQRSTGIGEGLAIPHGKTNATDRLVMAVGRPADPMDFGSVDGKPVRLLVLLASPPQNTADHIQALGRVTRLMSDAEFRGRMYRAESAEDLHRLLVDAEA